MNSSVNLSFSKFLFCFFWLLGQILAPSVWEILRRILVIGILQTFWAEKKTCTIKATLKELRWFLDICHRRIRQEFHHCFLTNNYSFSNLAISYLAPTLVHLNILRTNRGHWILLVVTAQGKQPPGSSCGWEWAVCAGTEPCTSRVCWWGVCWCC